LDRLKVDVRKVTQVAKSHRKKETGQGIRQELNATKRTRKSQRRKKTRTPGGGGKKRTDSHIPAGWSQRTQEPL